MAERDALIAKYQERPIRRAVIKIGSSSLVGEDDFREDVFVDMANQIKVLRDHDIEIALVSSGAVSIGRIKRPNLTRSPIDTQAAASIGQPYLHGEWAVAFTPFAIETPQYLVTDRDFPGVGRVMSVVLDNGCVPIINGNDTVIDPIDERTLVARDNDLLAAHVGRSIRADTLVLLTDTEGVLDEGEHLIDFLKYDQQISLFQAPRSAIGTGGMASKVEAGISFVRRRNQYVLNRVAFIANSKEVDVLIKLFIGKTPTGTMIHPW